MGPASLKEFLVRYTLFFLDPGGSKDCRVSPFLDSAGAAIAWLFWQKPFILEPGRLLEVRPFRKGDR